MDKLKIEYIDINTIKPYKNNAKKHPIEQIEQIKKSIEQFGMDDPIGIWKDEIVEGHGRLIACKELGYEEVPIIRLDHLTDEERKAYTLAHNKLTMNSDFDLDILNDELHDILNIDMTNFGFDLNLDDENFNDIIEEHGSLTDEYIIPPFSVFDTKQAYWQNRKRQWLELGIKSELGRDNNLTFKFTGFIEKEKQMSGISIFDPVLCEICYKWFNIDNGKIYDPFAGGSVRGIVANKLGYSYTGIDLRQEQISANYNNANELKLKDINWICDDSNNVDKYIENNSVDMIFSCPPYADLEVYSDNPKDLSNMDYEKFKKIYKEIITKACNKLKENRFAVFVVGDIRDKNGVYRNFIDYTKECFNENKCCTYNEIILLNSIGTAPVRCKKAFNNGRKVTKIHQNVLVFYKGDIKQIKNNYKELNLDDVLMKDEEEI